NISSLNTSMAQSSISTILDWFQFGIIALAVVWLVAVLFHASTWLIQSPFKLEVGRYRHSDSGPIVIWTASESRSVHAKFIKDSSLTMLLFIALLFFALVLQLIVWVAGNIGAAPFLISILIFAENSVLIADLLLFLVWLAATTYRAIQHVRHTNEGH